MFHLFYLQFIFCATQINMHVSSKLNTLLRVGDTIYMELILLNENVCIFELNVIENFSAHLDCFGPEDACWNHYNKDEKFKIKSCKWESGEQLNLCIKIIFYIKDYYED